MSGPHSHCQRYFGIRLELWQGNREASGVEAEFPASVSCCDMDLVYCIDFPVVSGIVLC